MVEGEDGEEVFAAPSLGGMTFHGFYLLRSLMATGTLVREVDIGHWTEKGGQFLYVHSDPFLRAGITRMKSLTKPVAA